MITNVSTCKHANLDCPGLFPSCNTEEECSSMLQAVHSTGDSAQSPLAPDVVPDCLLNAKALERFVSSKEVHAWRPMPAAVLLLGLVTNAVPLHASSLCSGWHFDFGR
eukprot:3941537-Rhodomonas_salina.15